jgi:hypothetical protein
VNSRRYLFENLGQIATSGHQAPDGSDLSDPGQLPLGNLKSATRGEGFLSTLGSWLRKE